MSLKSIIKNFKTSVSNLDEDKIDASLKKLVVNVKSTINKTKQKIKDHL